MDGTFRVPADHPGRLDRTERHLDAIEAIVVPEFEGRVHEAMPELPDKHVRTIRAEVILKAEVFVPGLLEGKGNVHRLARVVLAFLGMYLPDQAMDRGDQDMEAACVLLGSSDLQRDLSKSTIPVQRRFGLLRHMQEDITAFARPEDAPYVLERFSSNVLRNEVRMQELSRGYIASDRDPDYLAEHGREIAEISTIDAGFPTVPASLYAIKRHENPSLPPLAEIDNDPEIQALLQVCNVVSRLWDDFGDWQMDTGYDPRKGIFVLNSFNEYHPQIIDRFCELGMIKGERKIAGLQQAFSKFHEDRETHGAYIVETLRLHVREYFGNLSTRVMDRFPAYIDLCKRTIEMSKVNAIPGGDIALASSG